MDYLRLFRQLPYTSIVFGPDFSIVEATDEYLAMTQRRREEIVGHSVFEAFPDNPEDPNSRNTGLLRQSIERVIKTAEADVMDLLRYDIPRPEAEGGGFATRYWDVTHVPVKDENGKILYIIQKTGDATERIQTKKAWQDSEEQVKFILEAMPQLLWINDNEGNLKYLNKRWEEFTGINSNVLESKIWEELVHQEDRDPSQKAWAKAIDEKDSYQAYIRLKNKDGIYRWFLARAQPKKNLEGEIVYWVGSATDVHETKIMVDELLQSNNYLEELSENVNIAFSKAETERKTLERLIMEAPAMICIQKGPEHVYELINPVYQQALPGRDCIGRKCADVIPEAVEQGFITLLDNVYQNGETVVGTDMPLMLDRSGTGELEEAYFTFTYQPLYENDKITGIVTFAFEVTENVKLRKKLDLLDQKAQLL
jgi:PAS domain S-box-containing protein